MLFKRKATKHLKMNLKNEPFIKIYIKKLLEGVYLTTSAVVMNRLVQFVFDHIFKIYASFV